MRKTAAARQVTVQIWHPWHPEYGAGATFDALVQEFERLNPNINIEQVVAPPAELSEKMAIGLASGVLPDISWEDPLRYLDNGFPVVDIGPFLQHSTIRSEVIPSAWDMVTRDGHICGIPIEASPSAIHYNTERLRAAGLPAPSQLSLEEWTWDRFAELGQKLSRDINGDGQIDEWGSSMIWDPRGWGIFLRSAGGPIFDNRANPTRSLVNSEAGRVSLRFLRSLVERGIMFPESFGPGIRDPRMAMSLEGTWAVNAMLNAGVEFESWLTPRPEDGRFDNWVEQQAMFLLDNGDWAKIESAWRFLEWFCSTDVHARWAIGTGYLPVLMSAFKRSDIMAYFGGPAFRGHLQILLEGYGTVTARITTPNGRRALSAASLESVLPHVYLAEISPEAALEEMQRLMDAALR